MPAKNQTRRDNGEGTAPKQRGDGRWFRQITVEGKKKFIYGKTKAEVNQKFREFKAMESAVKKQACNYKPAF